MTSMQDRGKGFEAGYRHDKETDFRVQARRNKLLGLWAAEQMGLPEDTREAYAREVIEADLAEPGIDDVVAKVMADFKAKGVDISEHRVRRHIDEFNHEARDQIMKEAPSDTPESI